MKLGRIAGILFLIFCSGEAAFAARPLLDQHQWDRYFALFARDSDVPWKATHVRLDTYSSAPVALSAYPVRPEDVIEAGNPRGRAIDITARKPIVSWRFSPPPGYRVEGNDIAVPLKNEEGVFVIQAKRGKAVQQVWINRSRIGLVSKDAPRGTVIYGCDLGTGKPLAHLRLLFLVGKTLVTRYTDASGLLRWNGASRPSFVLAEWGNSRAFLTLLPQAPVPTTITGLRVDRAVVRSGDALNVVGFARQAHGRIYQRSNGYADVRVMSGSHVLANTKVRLDDAGAFVARLPIPSGLNGGTASVLANVNGASAGTAVTIEAAGDLGLWLHSPCMSGCVGVKSVPIAIHADRHGKPVANAAVAVNIVRYPHVVAPNKNLDASAMWGATEVLNIHGRTDANGSLRVVVPAPTDGLPSTLGVTAKTEGAQATASTRLSLPNGKAALAVEPEQEQVDVGRGVAVSVHGFDAVSGAPIKGFAHLRISHGPNAAAQTVPFDAHGYAHAVFTHPQMGTNLIVANYNGALGSAFDANSVVVAPRALTKARNSESKTEVKLSNARYRAPADITLDAGVAGAVGNALVSIDALAPAHQRSVPISHGRVHSTIHVDSAEGDMHASIAYVRNGALETGSVPLTIDGPGRERKIDLLPEKDHAEPGGLMHVAVREGNAHGESTTIVRLTDGSPSDSAIFDNAAEVLASGGVTTLVSASDDPPWHAWVTPKGSIAADFLAGLGHRPVEQRPPTLDAAATRVIYWHTEHSKATVNVPMPRTPGRYTLSILRIYNDGDVGGASTVLTVS